MPSPRLTIRKVRDILRLVHGQGLSRRQVGAALGIPCRTTCAGRPRPSCRTRKPRDKAKAEAGVLLAERWILARLRNRRFYSLAEAKAAVAECVAVINERPFRKMEGSRRSLFEELDRPASAPAAGPALRARHLACGPPRVNIDYHVEADGHYYSVPTASWATASTCARRPPRLRLPGIGPSPP